MLHVRTRQLRDGRVAVETMTRLHWEIVVVCNSQGEANIEIAMLRAAAGE